MKLSHNDPKALYMGRYDRTAEDTRLYHPGAQVRLKFNGTSLSAVISCTVFWGVLHLGIVIDGEVKAIPLSPSDNGRELTVRIAEGLEKGEHTVIIYKRHAAHHSMLLKEFETDGEFLVPEPLPQLKIEAYGDSVCAGEIIEAVHLTGQNDPADHYNNLCDNVWNSFVMQTARNLNAQIHNISQGGIALLDGTGYYHAPNCIGLESVYDKTCFIPEAGPFTDWDFGKYRPDIVIIAVGQNDKHNAATNADDIDISDPAYRRKWKDVYIKTVKDLDGRYGGEARFILTTTVLMHDPDWDRAIDEITEELKASGVKAYHNLFSRNGAATPGHPRLPEHNEMARELTSFIKAEIL